MVAAAMEVERGQYRANGRHLIGESCYLALFALEFLKEVLPCLHGCLLL